MGPVDHSIFQLTACHDHPSSQNLTSQPTTLGHNHIANHSIPFCPVSLHHITSHDGTHTHTHILTFNTSHRITRHDMTALHITSPAMTDVTKHLSSQPTRLPHFTWPHIQLHYFISSCNQLIPHHITAHLITTTDTPRKRNVWRLVHRKNSVWASRRLVILRTFYRQTPSLPYGKKWNFGSPTKCR